METWRDVVDYEGEYQVSDEGRVRSVDRVIIWKGAPKTIKGKMLRRDVRDFGYLYVKLSRNGVRVRLNVHRLVLRAFKGEPPPGQEGCHEDGDPANCRLSNLRWDTRSGNHKDKVAHGTSNRGERHENAKLTEADVQTIRLGLRDGRSLNDLARSFGVNQCAISHIKAGRRWGWLPQP